MTQSAIQSTYDQLAPVYAARLPGFEREATIDLAALRWFVELLPAAPMVLDAGCGTGRLMPALKRLGCRVEGVDLSPIMVEQATRANPGDLVRQADIASLPHGDEELDGIVAWYSLIHHEPGDLESVLAEFHRVLVPGGAVCLAFQTGEGSHDIGEGFRPLGDDVSLLRHLFDTDTVAGALTAQGFTVSLRLERAAQPGERDPQAIVIAARD